VTLDSLWGVLESYWEYLERTGGKLEKNGENYQLSKHLNFFREGWGGVSLTKDQIGSALPAPSYIVAARFLRSRARSARVHQSTVLDCQIGQIDLMVPD